MEKSWDGLFRQEILAELPVEQLACGFRADFGRPCKELPTVLGVLVLRQMHDRTDPETVNQPAFKQQWHYALDIPSESDVAKYLCPKTLWTMRHKVTDQELDTVLFRRFRAAAVRRARSKANGSTSGSPSRCSWLFFSCQRANRCVRHHDYRFLDPGFLLQPVRFTNGHLTFYQAIKIASCYNGFLRSTEI